MKEIIRQRFLDHLQVANAVMNSDILAQIERIDVEVKKALARLPVKEQQVLCGLYVDEVLPSELAQTIDVSLTHIYRLQKQGVRRVRGILSRLIHEMKEW